MSDRRLLPTRRAHEQVHIYQTREERRDAGIKHEVTD